MPLFSSLPLFSSPQFELTVAAEAHHEPLDPDLLSGRLLVSGRILLVLLLLFVVLTKFITLASEDFHFAILKLVMCRVNLSHSLSPLFPGRISAGLLPWVQYQYFVQYLFLFFVT